MRVVFDFSEVTKGLERLIKDLETNTPKCLYDASDVIIDEAELNLEKGGNPSPPGTTSSSTPTGELLYSLDTKTTGNLGAGYETLVGSWEPYALPVEVGTAPQREVRTAQALKSGDPVTVYEWDIRDWLFNQGFGVNDAELEKMTNRMVQKLVDKGADPHPFIKPAFDERADDFFVLFTKKLSNKVF